MCLVPPMAPAAEDSSIPSACSAPTAAVEGRISSKYRGLCWDKKHHAWRVRIFYCGKQRHVGRYRDDVTAARAYDKAAAYLYGSKAILNFTMEECLTDPSEVSGFITLAKEQAMQQQQQQAQQQQQQQQGFLNSSLQGSSLLPSNSTCGSQTGANDDVYQQLSLLAAQRATFPVDPAVEQHFLQASSILNPVQNPMLQQLQPQAAFQAADLESSTRMLLLQQQQQQQHAFTAVGAGFTPQQQVDRNALYCSSSTSNSSSMAATLSTPLLPIQSTAFPASSSALGLVGTSSIFGSSSSNGCSSSNDNGATLLVAPSLGGTSRTICLPVQGQMLSVGSTSGGTTGCSTTPMRYVILQGGQQLLLPTVTAAQNAANNILLQGYQHFTDTASYPLQQQRLQTATFAPQQQQFAAARYTSCSNSCSSSAAQSPILTLPQQLAYASQQQQQLSAVPSSSSMVAVGSPQVALNLLQQQQQQRLQASPMQLPVSAAISSSSSSDGAALLSLMQKCSISQHWV